MKLTIKQDTCTQCGICFDECPSGAVTKDPVDGAYTIFRPYCIACSHCGMVCPVDAVETDRGVFPELKGGKLPPGTAESFVRGRRSVRIYDGKDVPKEIIENLLYTGSLTSTASNRQEWKAIVLYGGSVQRLSDRVMDYYAGLLRMAKTPLVRGILKFTEASRYVSNPHALTRFESFIARAKRGEDPLFFKAPVVVILTARRKEKRFGNTDCVLAGSAMMYTAQAYGLGSCMIGFAERALNLKKSIKTGFAIPENDVVHLVFTLGYHSRRYFRLPVRETMPVTYLE